MQKKPDAPGLRLDFYVAAKSRIPIGVKRSQRTRGEEGKPFLRSHEQKQYHYYIPFSPSCQVASKQ